MRVGVDALPFAVKPNDVVAPAPREPFQDRFRTVTADPLTVSVPLHSWVMLWPLASVQRTVQAVIAELPARTVTVAWKPPCQEFVTDIVAEQAPVVGGVDDVTGGVVVRGGVVAGVVVTGGVVVVGGFGTPWVRLDASCGWKLPAWKAQPSASPGGLTHR